MKLAGFDWTKSEFCCMHFAETYQCPADISSSVHPDLGNDSINKKKFQHMQSTTLVVSTKSDDSSAVLVSTLR